MRVIPHKSKARPCLSYLTSWIYSTRLDLHEREYDVPPIITDGARLQSTHWTGHYIRDPTIAFCDVPPWSLGEMQALGLARTWSGKARLPNESRMWDEYDKTKDLYRGDIFSRKDECKYCVTHTPDNTLLTRSRSHSPPSNVCGMA